MIIDLVIFKQPSMVNNNNFNNGYFCALMHMKHMAIRNAYCRIHASFSVIYIWGPLSPPWIFFMKSFTHNI